MSYLGIGHPGEPRELPFAALGRSGHNTTARDMEQLHRAASGLRMLAVVDAGPLYATADADDEDHERCRTALSRADLRLVIPALVVAEATYFVGRRLGARAEAAFLRGLAGLRRRRPRG